MTTLTELTDLDSVRLAGPSRSGGASGNADLSDYCHDLFTSFSRSDQRRWGEIYALGLTFVPGRKSIRRIADDIAGWRADQCLQQFLNQSPWDWRPVRQRMAEHVAEAVRPTAWVVDDAVFPKNGENSVGVAKQFVPSAGAVVNCQLGLTVSMASHRGSCPVTWRLMLPRCWEDDDVRRRRTHLPAAERHLSRADHVLAAADELVSDWGLAPLPLLVPAQHEPDVHPLLAGLEERGLRYLVQVAPGTAVSAGHSVSVAEVVLHALRRSGAPATPPAGPGGERQVQYLTVNLSGVVSPYELGSGRVYPGVRRILARWSPQRERIDAVWLTNVNAPRLADLVDLTMLFQRSAADLERMGEECGLKHFEGRSFRGWHHHTTLASVAHSFRLLSRLRAEDRAEVSPVAVGAAGLPR